MIDQLPEHRTLPDDVRLRARRRLSEGMSPAARTGRPLLIAAGVSVLAAGAVFAGQRHDEVIDSHQPAVDFLALRRRDGHRDRLARGPRRRGAAAASAHTLANVASSTAGLSGALLPASM